MFGTIGQKIFNRSRGRRSCTMRGYMDAVWYCLQGNKVNQIAHMPFIAEKWTNNWAICNIPSYSIFIELMQLSTASYELIKSMPRI